MIVNFRVPDDFVQKIDAIGKNMMLSRSNVIKVALAEFIDRKDKMPEPASPDAPAPKPEFNHPVKVYDTPLGEPDRDFMKKKIYYGMCEISFCKREAIGKFKMPYWGGDGIGIEPKIQSVCSIHLLQIKNEIRTQETQTQVKTEGVIQVE